MSRFSEPQDPLFQELNSSIGFDFRLAPYDIERGLAEVRAEVDEDRFKVDPGDEDVHMAIERRLTELVGDAGARLHTARSRNNQVATDVAMLVRAHALEAQGLIAALMRALLDLAERHVDWPMPGYTHLQRAQPVYLAHHLLAHFWMLRRDARRFGMVQAATAE